MKSKIVESEHGQGRGNHGKFLLLRFEDEWAYRTQLPGADEWEAYGGTPPLLLTQVCGWGPHHTWVLDLQTGEGALFRPGGYAKADLDKHAVWVCPLFEPFLEYAWQWVKDGRDLWDLPAVVELPEAEFAFAGYRRAGVHLDLTAEQAQLLLGSLNTDEARSANRPIVNALRATIEGAIRTHERTTT